MPYGVYSGHVKGKSIKVGSNSAQQAYVSNREILKKVDLIATYVSGTAASAKAFGATPSQIDTWAFTNDAINQIGFSVIVPTGIPESAKADISLIWSEMSGTITSTADNISGTGVVWGINYMARKAIISGVEVANPDTTYCLSGSFSNTSIVTQYDGGAGMMSGAINSVTLSIPPEKFGAGDIINGTILRDGLDLSDNMNTPAHLLYAIVEYR